jgi:hypothetical protein
MPQASMIPADGSGASIVRITEVVRPAPASRVVPSEVRVLMRPGDVHNDADDIQLRVDAALRRLPRRDFRPQA